MLQALSPAQPPVCQTVYSLVWPATEALVRRCLRDELSTMLANHQDAFTKQQDDLHLPFFAAWKTFAASAVHANWEEFPEAYPTAGSSEAIREIIRQARWEDQVLVVFDGDYEGYEATAAPQGTEVFRIDRNRWREQVEAWRQHGPPWGQRVAQWWISQPSAIDGNTWPDFAPWLAAMQSFLQIRIWVDLAYVGRARQLAPIDLTQCETVEGVVFSLSKAMGAYYRRIGGCLSRRALPGLWANRWFKNIDSLFLGQRWLIQAKNAKEESTCYQREQVQAMNIALSRIGADQWADAGITWRASDMPLLMHATPVEASVPEALSFWWETARRGRDAIASRRLCLTPSLSEVIYPPTLFKGPV